MARDVTVRCDRCLCVVEFGGSQLAPESGPLRKRRTTPYDFCECCGKEFLRWLAPELPALEPTEAVPEIMVPA